MGEFMERKLQIAFVLGALLVIFAPIAKFNRNGKISSKENRTLAEKPYLFSENRVNENLFRECDAYFNDRFGGRQKLISLNSWVDYSVLRRTVYNERALKGKGGWYFYISKGDGDNLSDFQKRNLMDESALLDFKKRVSEAKSWCDSQGIRTLFLVCPNKHSVYPEFYPFDRPDGITCADQICSVFEELGVEYVFPRDHLTERKADFDFPLYYETDTHWNPQGAHLASALLREKIETLFPKTDFPQIEYKSDISESETSGDILPMLNVEKARSTQVKFSTVNHKTEDFYAYLKNDGRNGVRTKGTDATLPRALIFRDSFFSSLEPFVSPLFSEAEYRWKQFDGSDREHVLNYRPDIIIFESVERYAPNIVRQ